MVSTQTILIQNTAIDVLRLDNLHPLYGGNKFFKLKLNIDKALSEKSEGVLTFGGAHSNHIYSTAAFCNEKKINCVGVIRGRVDETNFSPTLQFAKQHNMQLLFEDRSTYNQKSENEYLVKLKEKYPNYYFIPEGGNNELGIEGCQSIQNYFNKDYDFIFAACGTATTYLGILKSCFTRSKVIGISVLKGENKLVEQVNNYLTSNKLPISVSGNDVFSQELTSTNAIINSYALNGYAKFNENLFLFQQNFIKQHSIPLDYVYTSKLFFAVNDLLLIEKIPLNASVLVIHSGGLQGNKGFEERYKLT